MFFPQAAKLDTRISFGKNRTIFELARQQQLDSSVKILPGAASRPLRIAGLWRTCSTVKIRAFKIESACSLPPSESALVEEICANNRQRYKSLNLMEMSATCWIYFCWIYQLKQTIQKKVSRSAGRPYLQMRNKTEQHKEGWGDCQCLFCVVINAMCATFY